MPPSTGSPRASASCSAVQFSSIDAACETSTAGIAIVGDPIVAVGAVSAHEPATRQIALSVNSLIVGDDDEPPIRV